MGAIATISRKDLKERLRDKSFFIYGILTPLLLAFVLNLVFGDLDSGELEVRMGVIDADESELSTSVRSGFEEMDGDGGLMVTVLDSGDDAGQAIDEHGLDAVVALSSGFSEQLTTPGDEAPQMTVTTNPDRSVQAGVVRAIAEGVAADLQRTRLRNAAGGQLGADPDLETTAADLDVTREQVVDEGLPMSARMMAGMAVMFVFFTVQFGVTSLLEERKAGTMTRLLAAPITRSAIVGAKGVVSFVLGVVATLILLGAATLLMGADWGPWAGVVVLVLTVTMTAVAIMAVVAGLAKTSEGAGAIQSIIAVGLAMLGGSWFPLPDTGVMGVLSRLTPHYWFLGGLETLSDAASWVDVLPNAGILIGVAVLFGLPAAMLLRGRLAS